MTPLETIKKRKIVAIVRGLEPAYLLRLGHALEEGGIGLMEVTYNQREPETWADTARGIEALGKEFGDRLLAGAGTVITPEQVRMTYNAGGRYLVTPTTQPGIPKAVVQDSAIEFDWTMQPMKPRAMMIATEKKPARNLPNLFGKALWR